MARIKIKDLPQDMKISKVEMKKIYGGLISGSSLSSLKNLSGPSMDTNILKFQDGDDLIIRKRPG